MNSQTGVLYGKPTVVETKNVTITASDGVSEINLYIDKFKVSAAGGGGNSGASFTTTSLADGRVGQTYRMMLTSQGGVGPFIWGAQNLPVGITLNGQTGELSGTPLVAGTFYVTLTNTDTGENNVAFTTLPLTIYPADSSADNSVEPPLPGDYFFAFDTFMLNNGEVGSSYRDAYLTRNAKGSVRYSAMGLPTGLTLDPDTGIVSGTPAPDSAGTYFVTISAEDQGVTPAQVISTNLPLWIAPSSSSNFHWNYFGVPAALYGRSYSSSFPISVDTKNGGSVSYSAIGLPPGISYSATSGVLSGTPTEVGVFPVRYTATSTTQGSISMKADFVVLPPTGGDVSRLAVNLWLKKLSVKANADATPTDSWQAQYIYNADRRSGTIFNPQTESMLLSMAASNQTLLPQTMSYSAKTGVFSYKSAKADKPALNIKGSPSTQLLNVKVAATELGLNLPATLLQHDVILGGKGYRLNLAVDSKGKFLQAKDYRSASFVVANAQLKQQQSNKDSLQLTMFLADPSLLAEFMFEVCSKPDKNCNRPAVSVKLYQGANVLLEKNITDLVAAVQTTDKTGFSRKQIKKVVKKDVVPVNQLKVFSFDNKTGAMKLSLAALQPHLGVEVTVGAMSYFTSVTLFETRYGSKQWSSKISNDAKPYPPQL